MTLVFGARCKDGVCLVGDRKITGSNNEQYTDKIRQLDFLPQIVFTAAGHESLFEEFLREIARNAEWQLNWIEEENKKHPEKFQRIFTTDDFRHACAQTLKDMKQHYSELKNAVDFDDALQVLFIVGDNQSSSLHGMDMDTC